MKIDEMIRDEKAQHNINREGAKISELSSGKIDKHKFLAGKNILPSDQSRIIELAKFTFFLLSKVLKNK